MKFSTSVESDTVPGPDVNLVSFPVLSQIKPQDPNFKRAPLGARTDFILSGRELPPIPVKSLNLSRRARRLP